MIGEDRPRIDARRVAGNGMAARAWPEIPADMLPLVEQLCGVLHRERGDELSTTWEERLPDLVSDLVERSVHRGGMGVAPVLAARLAGDAAWRAEVEWALLVRASLLWPLSLLVYEDVEDIQEDIGEISEDASEELRKRKQAQMLETLTNDVQAMLRHLESLKTG